MSTLGSVGSVSSAWSDGGASRASAMKARMFSKADADGSGGVDKTELQTMFSKIAEKTGTTAADAETQFSQMDTDGDGSLSADELDTGMKSLMPPPSSTMEFAQRMSGGQPPDGPPPGGPPPDGGGDEASSTSSTSSTSSSSSSSSTDPLDTNGDGTVSAQERAAGALKEMLQSLAKAMDSDGDGSISKDEISSFTQKLTSALQDGSGSTGSGASASRLNAMA